MKNNKQSGSGHLIIILAFVLVIAGILGFVYWQKYIKPKNDETVVVDNAKYAQIPEWSIKGVYEGSGPIRCIMRSGGAEYDGTSVSSSIDKTCDLNYSDGVQRYNLVSSITRYAANETVYDPYLGQRPADAGKEYFTAAELFSVDDSDVDLTNWSFETNNYASKHIGEYYYVYTIKPLSLDPNASSSVADGSDSKMLEFFNSLKAES